VHDIVVLLFSSVLPAIGFAFAEASPPGAPKNLSAPDEARVAAIVPACAVLGNGRG